MMQCTMRMASAPLGTRWSVELLITFIIISASTLNGALVGDLIVLSMTTLTIACWFGEVVVLGDALLEQNFRDGDLLDHGEVALAAGVVVDVAVDDLSFGEPRSDDSPESFRELLEAVLVGFVVPLAFLELGDDALGCKGSLRCTDACESRGPIEVVHRVVSMNSRSTSW